jgi:hypothetical protein
MFLPDETALVNLLWHPFFVRSRHFWAPTVVRFKNAAQRDSFSLGTSNTVTNFSRLWRGLEQTALNKARL